MIVLSFCSYASVTGGEGLQRASANDTRELLGHCNMVRNSFCRSDAHHTLVVCITVFAPSARQGQRALLS
jgi:hypothetical protein